MMSTYENNPKVKNMNGDKKKVYKAIGNTTLKCE
jgi:hypothetical protein